MHDLWMFISLNYVNILKADDQIEIINIHGKGYKLIVPDEE